MSKFNNKQITEWIVLYLGDELSTTDRQWVEQMLLEDAHWRSVYDSQKQLDHIFGLVDQPHVEAEAFEELRLKIIGRIGYRSGPASHVLDFMKEQWAKLTDHGVHPVLAGSLAALALVIGLVINGIPSDSSSKSQQGAVDLSLPPESRLFNNLLEKRSDYQMMGLKPRKNGGDKVSFEFQTPSQDLEMTVSPANSVVQNYLIQLLKSSKNPNHRRKSLRILEDYQDVEQVEEALITTMLTDIDDGVRLKAIAALKDHRITQNLQEAYVRVLMSDDNPRMRSEAAQHLSRVRDHDLLPVYQYQVQVEKNAYVTQILQQNIAALEADNSGATLP